MGRRLGRLRGRLAYCDQARAIFSVFTTPPAAQRCYLIDQSCRQLVEQGVWYRLNALHVYAAANNQAALTNWILPGTFTATENSSPTFTADRGYATNGTSSYVNIPFNPTSSSGSLSSQDNASWSIWSLTSGQTTSTGNGSVDTSSINGTNIRCRDGSDNQGIRVNAGAVEGAANTDGTGCYTATRGASNSQILYRNGIATVSGTGASTVNTNDTFNVGRTGANGSIGFAARTWAMSAVGGNLTAAQAQAFYAIMLAYMQTVGAVT